MCQVCDVYYSGLRLLEIVISTTVDCFYMCLPYLLCLVYRVCHLYHVRHFFSSPCFLSPAQAELDVVKPALFSAIGALLASGADSWNKLETSSSNSSSSSKPRISPNFRWNPDSTFLQRPDHLRRFLDTDEKGEKEAPVSCKQASRHRGHRCIID